MTSFKSSKKSKSVADLAWERKTRLGAIEVKVEQYGRTLCVPICFNSNKLLDQFSRILDCRSAVRDATHKCESTFGYYKDGKYKCNVCSELVSVKESDFKRFHVDAVSFLVGLCDDDSNIFLVSDPSLAAVVVSRDFKILSRNCRRFTSLDAKNISLYCNQYVESASRAAAAGTVVMYDATRAVAYLLSSFHHPERVRVDHSVLSKLFLLSTFSADISALVEKPGHSKAVDPPASSTPSKGPKPKTPVTKTRRDRKVRVDDHSAEARETKSETKQKRGKTPSRKATRPTTPAIPSEPRRDKPPTLATKRKMLNAITSSLQPATDSSLEK
uniref:Uncharacterized protein n=1 Tax=viral metagenome TaxID=1070528 RepID=A0A2V0R9Q2_9ZZZZ